MEMFLLLASLHMGDGREDYETFTPGIGGYLSENVAVMVYRNSVDANSIGVYYDTRWPTFDSRIVLGAASGYEGVDYKHGKVRPWEGKDYKGILPVASFVYNSSKHTFITWTAPAIISMGVRF